jgi:hypothetical protein
MTAELERALLALTKRVEKSTATEARLEMFYDRHGMGFTQQRRDECYDMCIAPAKRVAALVRKQVPT